jgi:hypothetical protein
LPDLKNGNYQVLLAPKYLVEDGENPIKNLVSSESEVTSGTFYSE